jgi:hypothetical protein
LTLETVMAEFRPGGDTATDVPAGQAALTLNDHLHDLLDDAELTDEAALLARAVRDIPREVIDQALHGLLRDRLRLVRAERRRANGLLGGPLAAEREHPALGRGTVHSGRSMKVQTIRDNADKLEAWFSDEIWVGTRRRKLGDATSAELHAAASFMRRTAENAEARAVRFEKLAGLLDEHGAEMVRQLPAEALYELARQA